MFKKFFLLIILMLFAINLQSQINPIKFVKDSLENGLKIIYCIDKSAPTIATVLFYKVGSKDEISSQTGYAHFFEHLMFEATENIPRSSIDKYVQEAGGDLNAHTTFDETVYYFELPSNQLNLALWVESQRMRKLKVDTAGVETQRGVVLEEMKERTTNQPYGTLIQKTMEHLFDGTSYGWDVLGYDKNIASATIENFKLFYNKYYHPNNAVLVIAGDFEIPEAKKLVRNYFGIYQRGPALKKDSISLPQLNKAYRETFYDEKVQLPGVFISYRGPSKNDPDYYAMSILTDILASGESSRLYKRLVDKEQIAVEASVMPLSLHKAGLILFVGIATPGKDIQEVEKIILEEVNNIIQNGVIPEELTKAKNITEANYISDKKNNLEKAEDLAENEAYYGGAELINSELNRFLKVTENDIKRVAKKYFGTDKNVTLIYLPKEK